MSLEHLELGPQGDVGWLKCSVHRFGDKCAGGKNVNAERGGVKGKGEGVAHAGKEEALDRLLRGGGARQQLPIVVWVRGQHFVLARIPLLFLEHLLMHQRHEEEDDSSDDWGHTGKVEGHMVVPKTVAQEAWNSETEK